MGDQNKTTVGWVSLIAALGVMATLMASEIRGLMTWSQMAEPGFVAALLIHFGTVVGAFIGGKNMPN